jgi:hypothetical protein
VANFWSFDLSAVSISIVSFCGATAVFVSSPLQLVSERAMTDIATAIHIFIAFFIVVT